MMKRNQGFIASVASAMGLTGVPRMGDYCASKHAIVGFTDTLRMELKKFKYDGVKTLVVCPSGIDTGMFAGYKAPLFSPLLKPETVARKTLEAIKKERTYLKLPFIVKLIPSMKLFPATIQDVFGKLTGLLKSMDYFQGKGTPTTLPPLTKAK
jgi:short-subunit dehydrogenase